MQLQHQHPEEALPTALALPRMADASIEQTTPTEEEAEAEVSQSVADLLATAEKQKPMRNWSVLFGIILGQLVVHGVALIHTPSAALFYVSLSALIVFVVEAFAQPYCRTTLALAQMDDIRMIGPLIDRLHSEAKVGRGRGIIRQALLKLLPRLKASDAQLVSPSQKGRLAQDLSISSRWERDREFQIVVLGALEQIGDAQAIEVVQRIAWQRPQCASDMRVQAAAVECLPFLRQRVQEETLRQTLLRASEPNTSADMLLRSASKTEETAPQQLLRASDVDEP